MKISVLGTGVVGQTIARKMSELGHNVYMGTRNVEETKSRSEPGQMTGMSFADWYKDNQEVGVVNYVDLPEDTDIFINATNGKGSIEALSAVGNETLHEKIILDVANPLDFSQGMPPSLFICNTDSLGEQIQREFPDSKVVKGFNTMNCYLMMDPELVPGEHTVFICGNDDEAKKEIRSLMNSLGWRDHNIMDLGDITNARGMEMILPLWAQLYGVLGTHEFNFHIARK